MRCDTYVTFLNLFYIKTFLKGSMCFSVFLNNNAISSFEGSFPWMSIVTPHSPAFMAWRALEVMVTCVQAKSLQIVIFFKWLGFFFFFSISFQDFLWADSLAVIGVPDPSNTLPSCSLPLIFCRPENGIGRLVRIGTDISVNGLWMRNWEGLLWARNPACNLQTPWYTHLDYSMASSLSFFSCGVLLDGVRFIE